MSVEYKLYDNFIEVKEEKIAKFKERLTALIEKEFSNYTEKNQDEDNEEINNIRTALLKIVSKTEKNKKCNGLSICTVTSSKIYKEIELEKIKEKMESEPKRYVIKGDDNSVYKNFVSFEKIINNAEKNMEKN